MSLMEDFKVNCVILDKQRVTDGEGGFTTKWVEGAKFPASIKHNTTLEAKIAEKQGVTSLYTVDTAKNAMLSYHDVFKRLYDGKIFRVTSDGEDKQSPERASFSFSQVTAEEYKLP